MILPIYIYGQPVLRKVSQDITPDYPELKELISNMFETLTASDGVGLAAPQIGLDIRQMIFPNISALGKHTSILISWNTTIRMLNLRKKVACRCRAFMRALSAPRASV